MATKKLNDLFQGTIDAVQTTMDAGRDIAGKTGDFLSDAVQTTMDAGRDIAGKTGDFLSDAVQTTMDTGRDITGKTGDFLLDATQTTSETGTKISTTAIDYTKEGMKITANYISSLTNITYDNAKHIVNKIWENTPDVAYKLWKNTSETGAVLALMIQDAYKVATSPPITDILKECANIAVIAGRIAVRIYSISDFGLIKKRLLQGTAIGGTLSFIKGAAIGAVLGAAFAICEIVCDITNDSSIQQDARKLYSHCQNVSFLVKKHYFTDISNEKIKSVPLLTLPA